MHVWLYSAVFSGMLMCAAASNQNELRLRISIPKDVAVQAGQRLAGDATVPAPILILHGLEFGANEGFKIKVLGELKPGATPVLLAVTGVVGHPQRIPQSPLQKIDLPVPLNEDAAQFLASRSEVTIILRFEHIDPQRPPVKVESVFLQSSIKQEK